MTVVYLTVDMLLCKWLLLRTVVIWWTTNYDNEPGPKFTNDLKTI